MKGTDVSAQYRWEHHHDKWYQNTDGASAEENEYRHRLGQLPFLDSRNQQPSSNPTSRNTRSKSAPAKNTEQRTLQNICKSWIPARAWLAIVKKTEDTKCPNYD